MPKAILSIGVTKSACTFFRHQLLCATHEISRLKSGLSAFILFDV